MAEPVSLPELARRVLAGVRTARPGGRYLLGLAGAPAAGKSTLAAALRAAIDAEAGSGTAQVAPLDGFHLDNATLAERGMLARKGEPDTFDAAAFVAALSRLRDSRPGEPVSWPAFDREHEVTVAGAIQFVTESVAIVEGNYLLVDDAAGRWSPVRALLHESWYVNADSDTVRERLVRRYIAGGRSREWAENKAFGSDMSNMRLVETGKKHADVRLWSVPDKSDQNCTERGQNGYVLEMKNDRSLRKPE